MKKWVRWEGLIAFVVIMGAGAALWLLTADRLVEHAIESVGTTALGARVDIKEADLTLMPLGLTITGLEVTDPGEPMTNLMEAERIAFLMDSGRILLGKVLINEISAEGIRLGTKRRTSGAIATEPEDKNPMQSPSADETSGVGGLSVPDIDEILGREELDTLKLAEAAETDIKQKETHWDARIKTLPDGGTIREFESRYKKIEKRFKGSTSEKLAAIKEAEGLKKDIKTARDTLKAASADLEADYKTLSSGINMAITAPERDIRRLKDKYQISSKGLDNASALLLGQRINGYLARAISIYERLKPLMQSGRDEDEPTPERGKGADLTFREYHLAPTFWARTIRASVQTSQGPIEGALNELSSDQGITGMPATFEFSSRGLKKTRSLRITGTLDHRTPEAPEDRLDISIEGRRLENMILSDSEDLAVSIKDAMADLTVNARLVRRGAIDARARLAIGSADIEASTATDNAMMEAIGATLSSMDEFSVRMKATGTIDDYDLSISSDMDNALRAAAKDMLRQEGEKFEDRLRAAIKDRTDKRLSSLTAKLKGLDDQRASLGGQSDQLDTLLKNASNIKASHQTEDKLKKKLNNTLKKLL